MVTIEILDNSCKAILPDVRKKSKIKDVIKFWRENRDDFDSTMRDWRMNTEGNIFLFVKEYSSLLVYYLMTGSEYPGNLKLDLEDLYGSFLKNMFFGGRYIVDSYLKISNYNNSDQLRYDEKYLLDNIKHAIECGISEHAISSLSKTYINKGIIAGIFDNPNESGLWDYLSEYDKNYFKELFAENISFVSDKKLKSVSAIDDEVDLFNKLVADKYEGKTESNVEFVDNKSETEEKIIGTSQVESVIEESQKPIEEPTEFIVDETIEESPKEEVEEQQENIIETVAEVEEEKAEEEHEPSEDESIEVDKSKISIVVISSETQMNQVRLAFSQDWLNRNHDQFNWPYNVDFKNDITLLDGWVDAPKTSIKTIAKYDLIIIGHNDHILKDMPKEYTEGGKKDGGIKKCLLDLYNVGEGHVYFPEKNKRPDLSVTNLRACLCDYMSRHNKGETLL